VLARRDTDERDHPSRSFVPPDGEPRLLEAYGHGLEGEPQLTVDTLAKAPAVLLPDPDEVVDLHGARLVLEEAGHDELVRGIERDHSIQVAQLSAEIAKREHEPTTSSESRRHAFEDAREVGLVLEMRERVAHADGQLDRGRHKLRDVPYVAGDRLDRQTARPVPQLGEEPLTEVDGQHLEAQTRQCDGLEAGAAAEIYGRRGAVAGGDAQSFQQRLLLGNLGLEVAEHTRVVLRQHRVVVVADRRHVGSQFSSMEIG
jgi:hypothetical protein